jgi:hypothetical protein
MFKRLGFLAGRAGAPNSLISACAGRLGRHGVWHKMQ